MKIIDIFNQVNSNRQPRTLYYTDAFNIRIEWDSFNDEGNCNIVITSHYNTYGVESTMCHTLFNASSDVCLSVINSTGLPL